MGVNGGKEFWKENIRKMTNYTPEIHELCDMHVRSYNYLSVAKLCIYTFLIIKLF